MNTRNPIVEFGELQALGLKPSPALLQAAANCAEAMRRLEAQMKAEFWSAEHFGITDDGRRWVSDEFVQWVGEKLNTSHLVQKEVTYTRGGKQYTRKQWVRKDVPKSDSPAPRAGTPAEQEAAEAAVVSQLARAGATSDADVEAFAAALTKLPRQKLRALNRSVGQGAGRTRAEAASRLVDELRARRADGYGLAGGAPREPAVATVVDPGSETKLGGLLTTTTAGELGAIGCGIDGASVRVRHDRPYTGSDDALYISTTAGGLRTSRKLYKDGRGKLVCDNQYFRLDKEADAVKAAGATGADLLANQVKALRSIGVTKIKTLAAGNKQTAADGGFNGYYTWARCGYDGAIKKSVMAKLPPDVVKQMGGSNRLLKLFEIEGGPEAWKEHGSDTQMTFDLSPDSPNIKALERYLASRRNKKAEA